MSFLVKVGLLDMRGDVCSVAELTRRWLDTGESAVIIAQLHSRTQFIGEMLNELRTAHDSGSRLHTWDVLKVANERYGFGWKNATELDSRRGWLQSAGLVSVPSDKRFQVTPHSADHTRLEAAVRDAFEFLGFRAERLGGSGKTDVLLNAIRGKDHSYRVTVDAKSVGESSSSKGRLRDQQVDWVTLQEHRRITDPTIQY